MSEEEKKAIDELWNKSTICKYEYKDYPSMICFKKDVIIVLNLIEKQQTLLEQKDKGINKLMLKRKKWKNRYYKERNKVRKLENKINKAMDKLKEVKDDFLDFCPDCVDLAEHLLKILEE